MTLDPEKDMDLSQLPCGCIVGTVDVGNEKAFVIKPHADDCEYYVYALEEAQRQGKPMIPVMATKPSPN